MFRARDGRLGGAALVAASLFVLWHGLAMVVAAGPPSHAMANVYPIFRPYLRALQLDNQWGFFSPAPGNGRALRYTVEDAAGGSHQFRLTEELDRRHPLFFRYTTLYANIEPDLPHYVTSAARHLCRRHADLTPVRVTFVVRHQLSISADSYAAGHRPLDEDYTRSESLEPVACPRGGA
jgi:hypothetical protein